MTVETLVPTRSMQPADQLLCQVATGDHVSFSALYAVTSTPVHSLIRRVLVDVSQSEEVTQEVYLEIWQLASRYDPTAGSAISWMLTIAHRRAIDRVRSSQASRNRDLKVGIRDWFEPFGEVADGVEIRLEHERAKRALDSLSSIRSSPW